MSRAPSGASLMRGPPSLSPSLLSTGENTTLWRLVDVLVLAARSEAANISERSKSDIWWHSPDDVMVKRTLVFVSAMLQERMPLTESYLLEISASTCFLNSLTCFLDGSSVDRMYTCFNCSELSSLARMLSTDNGCQPPHALPRQPR